MAMTIYSGNALSWALFRLRGGWRNIQMITFAYCGIIGALILLGVWAEPRGASQNLYWWTYGLIAIQGLVLILGGANGVQGAIRKDVTSRIIESHRLMPISSLEAVFGYIMGAVSQYVAIGAATLLIGTLVSAVSQVDVQDWLLANGIVLGYALCIWIISAFLALVMSRGVGVLLFILVISLINAQAPLAFIPAVAVLTAPLLGGKLFEILERGQAVDISFQISVLAMIPVTLFALVGAMRKYRREDQLAFGPVMGLMMMLCWLILSLIGLCDVIRFSGTMGRMSRDADTEAVQAIASQTGLMLLGLVPITAAAWLRAEYQRHRALKDPLPQAASMGVPQVVWLATIIGLLLPCCIPLASSSVMDTQWDWVISRILATLATVLACNFTVAYLAQILYRVSASAKVAIFSYLLVLWVVPFPIELCRHIIAADGRGDFLVSIGLCSPLGTLSWIWMPRPLDAWLSTAFLIGIGVQVGLAVMLGLLYHRPGNPRRARSRGDDPV